MTREIAEAFLWFLLFLLSAPVHEAAHGWVAKLGGDLTAYSTGQVTLNPLPHIKHQPIGMIVLPIISLLILGWPFGYASVPYDPVWAHNHPRKAAWMSAAGPAANLLIVVLCVIVVKVGIITGIFLEPHSVGLIHIVDPKSEGPLSWLPIVISMLFSLNLIMFILNLIPFPPLDGSGIVSLFLKDDAARSYRGIISNPMFGFIGLLLAWQIFNPIFNKVFPWVMNIIYWGAGFH
jgi:Zn-dependent protease